MMSARRIPLPATAAVTASGATSIAILFTAMMERRLHHRASTPTEAALLVQSVWLAPMLAAAWMLFQPAGEERRIRDAALLLLAPSGGWAVSCAMAWLLFPAYPVIGPPEHVALWVTVPGIAAAALVLWHAVPAGRRALWLAPWLSACITANLVALPAFGATRRAIDCSRVGQVAQRGVREGGFASRAAVGVRHRQATTRVAASSSAMLSPRRG